MPETALVVGQGSIGQRHARVLAGLGCTVATVSRRAEAGSHATLEAALAALAPGGPGYIVIATETAGHAPALTALATSGYRGRVLVEKPLFAAPLDVPDLPFARLAVAYQLRCHPALRRLRQALAGERLLSAHVHVGQYLPDWRPGRDYRTCYSSHAGLGGGVLRDLSHELDLANWLFGPWRRVAALGGKWSALEIDSDDHFVLLAAFARCPAVSIHLDYVDRQTRRAIVVNTDRHSFTLDLVAGTLRRDRELPETFAVERDGLIAAEHRAMLDAGGEGGAEPEFPDLCSLDDGLRVVAMIAAAERAARDAVWVDAEDSELALAEKAPSPIPGTA